MRRLRKPILSATGPSLGTSAAGRGCLTVFFSVFGLAGLTMLYFVTVRPLWMAVVSRGWEPAECLILSSEVVRNPGSDGDTFSIAISYRYQFHGREYTSARYTFAKVASSGFIGKQRVVDGYPIESRQECFVNPRDPAQAVLERGPTSEVWWGLFALPFIGVGSLAFFQGRLAQRGFVFRRSGAPGPKAPRSPAGGLAPGMQSSSGPVPLKTAASRGTQVLALLAVTLFWNGIVGVFVYHLVDGFQRHSPEWGLALFLTPFVLIGLALVGGTFWQALTLANPTLRVTASKGAVALGEEVAVEWEFMGAVNRLRSLKIFLEGIETATYTRGTDTRTDRNVFLSTLVVELSDHTSMRSGTARCRVPRTSMHSFTGGHNQIVWQLRFDGEIPRFPDVREEFTLTVLPLPILGHP